MTFKQNSVKVHKGVHFKVTPEVHIRIKQGPMATWHPNRTPSKVHKDLHFKITPEVHIQHMEKHLNVCF